MLKNNIFSSLIPVCMNNQIGAKEHMTSTQGY